MTATTTTATPGLIREAIEAAWERRLAPDEASFRIRLHDGMDDIGYAFADALWDRNMACDDAECPNRPGWDRALDEAANDAMVAARDEALTLIRERMAEFAKRFQAEHPEAVLRTVERVAA